VTGLDATLVYPRWTDPQKQSQKRHHLVRVRYHRYSGRLQPANVQGEENTNNGHETVSLILFLWPAVAMATRFRDGMLVEQNKTSEPLRAVAGAAWADPQPPELINNQWVRRYDISVTCPQNHPPVQHSIAGRRASAILGD
jgi:hypothetical protein